MHFAVYKMCYRTELDHIINPWRMHEGYGTWFVIHSFCPSSCKDKRPLLRAGKVMSMISMTMGCNVTRGFAKVPSFLSYGWLTLTRSV